MFLAWGWCLLKRSNTTGRWFLIFIGILFINILQSVFFFETNSLGINASLTRCLSYQYFAFCIFSVIYFTQRIFELDKNAFFKNMNTFITICSYLILLIFATIAVFKQILGWEIPLYVSNVNNYGMYLDLVMPFFIIKIIKNKDVGSFLFFSTSFATMLINDCKLNIIGMFFEVMILLLMSRKSGYQNVFTKCIIVVTTATCSIIAILFLGEVIRINGHGFDELLFDPIYRLITGTLYPVSISSIEYRVNVMIISMQWVVNTFGFGIGFGNSNLLMREVLGGYIMKDNLYDYPSISLHNAPMEILLDFGFIALYFFSKIIVKALKTVSKKRLADYEIIFCNIVFSSPIWILSPAGITTTYFLFIVIIFLTIAIYEKNVVNKT